MMSNLLYTVEDLVSAVRSQLDELNVDSVDTTRDILPALNRAQDYAMDVYARKYPEPILGYETMALSGSQQEYDIPENVFEDRILKVEIFVAGTYREVVRISFVDISAYETSSKTNIPYYYCIIGRKLRFIPAPTGVYTARIWYLKNPEKLVEPQGRITIVNSASNYVIVDSAGDSLTTESDQLGSYVNIVDGQTGIIKGSMQIQLIEDDKVTFRATPTRSTVLNRSITGDLDAISLSADDYLSPIDGTCVPLFGRPTGNFLIQYAVAELTRKLGGEAGLEIEVLKKFEKQVESSWAGRQTSMRVKKRSSQWGPIVRRLFFE